MSPPRKNPAAVALGKLAKGKPKTMTRIDPPRRWRGMTNPE